MTGRVVSRHQRKAQFPNPVRGQRQADEAATVFGHEVYRVGRGHLRRNHQIALVFPLLAIDKNEYPPIAGVLDDIADT